MRKVTGLVAAVLLLCGTAMGGTLATHPDAYDDGSTVWRGTTPFDNGSTVSGYVDWAVFAPGDFSYSGYTGTSGELVYAYQLFNTGSASLSQLSLSLDNQADSIGSFSDLSGDATSSTSLTSPGSAQWNFTGIATGGNSEGLAFSSTQVPAEYFGVIFNHGEYALAIPVPRPSATEIPEPATLSLLAVGGLALIRRKRA